MRQSLILASKIVGIIMLVGACMSLVTGTAAVMMTWNTLPVEAMPPMGLGLTAADMEPIETEAVARRDQFLLTMSLFFITVTFAQALLGWHLLSKRNLFLKLACFDLGDQHQIASAEQPPLSPAATADDVDRYAPQ